MDSVKVVLDRPIWLRKKIDFSACQQMLNLLKGYRLNTVCQKAACPNISECFSKKVATFLILGDICTRSCGFCNVHKGLPLPIDKDEPARLARAVNILGLKHVVITSVTRDDLGDGGADIFAQTILHLRALNKEIKIEVLIPDFKGNIEAMRKILAARPDIIAHNLETVRRLYPQVRSGADYQRSLWVLDAIKKLDSASYPVYTKSGMMLGLGERKEEVLAVFQDLRGAGCDFLSIGQYLAPSPEHLPVKEYIRPQQFLEYKNRALELGFLSVESGPYVRSSYQNHSKPAWEKGMICQN